MHSRCTFRRIHFPFFFSHHANVGEAIPNFLGDEAGKGANVVISQLHYYFEHHGLGEMEVYLHADGQNKNSCMRVA